ncbi:restriction endonuclease subunit S [Adlercreutzia equolifaciens]|uniref:restriction endonuclease subunit S n=1 Tax=Adlercreutzia equolifaciens TaxID=446660 RepID=UPI003AB80620
MDEQRKSESELVPALRFEGFTDPWEQRKLGELFAKGGSGGTPTATEPSYYNGEIPFLGIADIEDRYIDSTAKSLTEDGLNNSAAWVVPSGAICLAMYASVGKVGICELDLATSQAFYNMVFDSQALRDYVYARLDKADANAEWEPLISTGTQANLNAEKVKGFQMAVPCCEEADLVGSFFRGLDSLIALHQRKYEKLKTVKQSLLEKMLPKEGEDVPELRFEGFTDPWEQRKLGEYLCVSAETNKAYEFSREDVLSVSGEYGVVNQVEFQGRSFAGANVSGYGILRTGDLVYTKSPLKTNPYGIIKANLGRSGIVSTLYATYKTKNEANPRFIDVYFSLNPRVNRYLYPLVNKGAKNDMKVSAENAIRGYVVFPSLTEQAEIGALFAKIDSLIALHQRELEILKNLKKALLEKMFV